MAGAAERQRVRVNGIELSYLSQGTGPVVILMHGFPELAVSWRHQLGPIANAGYRAVAPDMRGYGASSAPASAEAYSQFHLAGDMVALMHELGETSAVLVGHDMGANLAWSMALTVPHRVRGVAALSIPHKPRGTAPPLAAAPPQFYQRRFQQPGGPEADLDRNVRTFLPAIFDRLSGSSDAGPARDLLVPDGQQFSDLFALPSRTPTWLRAADLSVYVDTFTRTGFRGALNWYRNIDRNWHLSAPWAPGIVTVPAAYIVGDRDIAYAPFHDSGVIASMHETVRNLTDQRIVPGIGHWIAQESPEQVNDFLLTFLARLN
jgi:pimeloyl-ACP methyl ester carboxylesterase